MTDPRPRKGPCLYTATGGRFWPFDPRPEDIRLEDIAIQLARVHRFNGASPMTVAQHSVEVSRRLPEHLGLQGLFHDAAEAWLGDLNGPLKRFAIFQTGADHRAPGFQSWHEIEGRILDAVGQAFGFSLPLAPEVHEADRRACLTEARDLLPAVDLADFDAWNLAPYDSRVKAWSAETARAVFLDRYQEIHREGD